MKFILGALVILIATGVYLYPRMKKNEPLPQLVPETQTGPGEMKLTSVDFKPTEALPKFVSCEGGGEFPSLTISEVTYLAKSLVLIVEDRDVPKVFRPDGLFDHFLLFNIPPETQNIGPTKFPGIRGKTSSGGLDFVPPCPPKEYSPNQHRYYFSLYALDTMLELKEGASKEDLISKMTGHILTSTQLMGTYKKQ